MFFGDPRHARLNITVRSCFPSVDISSVPSGHYTQGRDTHAGIASGNASSTVSYLQFLQSIEKAGAVRTLESLARIELGAQGGALLERVTTTRISKSGVATTTVRERFTAPDWHADGWFWTGLGGRSSSCQTMIRQRRLISRVQAMEEELKMLRSGVAVLLHDLTPGPADRMRYLRCRHMCGS